MYQLELLVVQLLPGYRYNIRNLSGAGNHIMVICSKKQFDSNKPGAFFEIV
jgi:hypothetical protein